MKEETTTNTAPSTGKTNGKWSSKEGVKREAQAAMDTARDVYTNISDYASTTLSGARTRVVDLVREYPGYTAAGALAIGFILGAAIRRRAD
jgi:hypothetical protein